jgi:transposase-like protein
MTKRRKRVFGAEFKREAVKLVTAGDKPASQIAQNDEKLTLAALRMALDQRQPEPGLLHHSDRGTTYASSAYQDALEQNGIICSMSRKGNCWDNAVVESFFSTLDFECGAVVSVTRGCVSRRRRLHPGLLQPDAATLVPGLQKPDGIRACSRITRVHEIRASPASDE